MSRQTLLLLLVIVLATILLTLAAFNIENIRQFVQNPKAAFTKADPNTEVDEIVRSPISSKNPYLYSTSLAYVFRGKITDIRQTSNGRQVFTDITGRNVPPFILRNATQYYRGEDNDFRKATMLDLSPGQNVQILVFYHLTKKIWSVGYVSILVDQLPQK